MINVAVPFMFKEIVDYLTKKPVDVESAVVTSAITLVIACEFSLWLNDDGY